MARTTYRVQLLASERTTTDAAVAAAYRAVGCRVTANTEAV